MKVLLNQKKWAPIIVDSFHYLREIRDEITQIMREQIEDGIAQGKFKAELNDFLIEQLASLIMSSIRNQMQAGYSERNSELTCEHILRLLGFPVVRQRKPSKNGGRNLIPWRCHYLVFSPRRIDMAL
ncbi:MAG: hypothetical protein AAF512_01920 [Pseudomonadota bacterium]